MPRILIRLDPRRLTNPDADLRYAVTDLLIKRSGGLLLDDGYDYCGEPPFLVILLQSTEPTCGLASVLSVVHGEQVLGANLAEAAVVAIEEAGGGHLTPEFGAMRVVFPEDFEGVLWPE